MADSLKKHHPDVRLRCYLVESDITAEDSRNNRFDVVSLDVLNIPNPKHFLFQYTAFELCCALKPFCILHELENEIDAVLFLDADMFVCAPLLDELEKREGDILLTPHLRRPEMNVDFHYFLRTGQYNAGFIFARNTNPAKDLLEWWRDRLEKDCYRDYMGGVLDDQGWLDMAVALFDAVKPLRHLGINVAHWNMHECDFSKSGEQIFAAPDIPLCLFHFSTFQYPGLTKHKTVSDSVPPIIDELASGYGKLLAEADNNFKPFCSYSFAAFSDGGQITPAMREAVRLGRIPLDINPFENHDKVKQALPAGEPEEILNGRMDHLFASMKIRCADLDSTKKRLWKAENHLQRIEGHPVLGPILRFWRRFVNKEL